MKNANKKIIFLSEVQSTNNYANQLILSDAAEHGTVVLAQHQSKGRGQRGNGWESEFGENLLASIVLFPVCLPAAKQFEIAKIASISVLDFLQAEVPDVSIKWPNDIYVGEKKIAGILIENTVKGRNIDSSVVGIGLNLNQALFRSDAPNPVSLKQLTGKQYAVENVAQSLASNIQKWWGKLETGLFGEIHRAYLSKLYRNGQWQTYRAGEAEFQARIVGIGEFGQLKLEKQDGTIAGFMFKEVAFVV